LVERRLRLKAWEDLRGNEHVEAGAAIFTDELKSHDALDNGVK
jgi:hypothetical protein